MIMGEVNYASEPGRVFGPPCRLNKLLFLTDTVKCNAQHVTVCLLLCFTDTSSCLDCQTSSQALAACPKLTAKSWGDWEVVTVIPS